MPALYWVKCFRKEKCMAKANVKILFSIVFIVFLMLSLAQAMPVFSQGPGTSLKTWLLLSVAPNPVGINQTVYINAFMSKPTMTATGVWGDRYENITVRIITPSGRTINLGPYTADPTGGIWASFIPTELGEYRVKAYYPGQTLTGDSSVYPGSTTRFGTNLQYRGTYMLPSESEEVVLVVQAEPIKPQYQTPPLPSYFWSRPVYATNWDWRSLAGGHWFGGRATGFATTGLYDAEGSVSPAEAPNAAHILWTKPTRFGGLIGAPFYADQEHVYEATSILVRQFEPIILNGRLYYTHYPSHPNAIAGWVCVDIRTGEEIWYKPAGKTGDEIIRVGHIQYFHSVQEYGAWAFLWSVPRTGTIVYRIYDAMTGTYMANVTGGRSTSFLVDDWSWDTQGSLLSYYIVGNNLVKWNSSQMICYPTGFDPTIHPQRTYRISGNYTWSRGEAWPGSWSVPVNFTIAGKPVGTLSVSMSKDVILLYRIPSAHTTGYSYYISGYILCAGIDPKTGKVLWGPKNITIPDSYGTDTTLIANREGYFVLHDKDNNRAWGFSSKTGELLWGPVKLTGNAWSHIARAGQVAYETAYIWDFGGYCNALDAKTGKIKWTFTRGSSGYDAPYGSYPFWYYQIAIVDGKLFLLEGSLYNPPLHPAKLVVVDAFTGEEVWSILFYGSRVNTAHADGIAIAWNSLDGQIYAFGKGPTKTTVTAPNVAVPKGTTILIEGSVMDISAGTKDSRITARFPDGVPAVADESMSSWMEYVYMQQVLPTDVKGVWVTFDAVSPDGKWINIGGTHTDGLSGTFAIPWAPPEEGLWTIVITFPGTESYYSSYAQTSVYVTAPPPEPQMPEIPEMPEIPTPPDYTMILTALLILVVIAIIISAYSAYNYTKLKK